MFSKSFRLTVLVLAEFEWLSLVGLDLAGFGEIFLGLAGIGSVEVSSVFLGWLGSVGFEFAFELGWVWWGFGLMGFGFTWVSLRV